jgi:outer membrane protein assembly factor BamB
MKSTALVFSLFLISGFTHAQDGQWRGPERSGIFPESGLLKSWPTDGPELIMKASDLGGGYSQPVLVDGTVYIAGKKDSNDVLTALDLHGNKLYEVIYGNSWNETYPESRSTPTVIGDKIYLVSGMGEVVCINKADGKILWSVNAQEMFSGETHRWGIAESPLVIDDKVIYTTGGKETSVVALNKDTGAEVWKTESVGGARTYVSPVIYKNGSVRQIVASTSDFVIGIDPSTGSVSWRYKYLPENTEEERGATNSTNSAIIKGNELFISKGYDQYGVMLTVAPDGKSVQEKWRTKDLDTHHGHYVTIGDYIYGSNWLNNSKGNWVCLEWKTGKKMYEQEWITKGPIVSAEGLLYCYEERTGNVALVNPNPEKFDIISTFKIAEGSGPHWAHPYIKDGKLLIRHGDVLMVFNIKA